MSRDIRSYFMSKGTKNNSNKEQEMVTSQKKKHKRVITIDSDSEEDTQSPKKLKQSTDHPKDNKKDKHNKQSTELKSVNVSDIFGTNKVKRSESKTSSVKKSKQSQSSLKNDTSYEEIFSDSDFEATLRQIDEIETAHVEKGENKSKNSSDNANKSNSSGKHKEVEKGDHIKSKNSSDIANKSSSSGKHKEVERRENIKSKNSSDIANKSSSSGKHKEVGKGDHIKSKNSSDIANKSSSSGKHKEVENSKQNKEQLRTSPSKKDKRKSISHDDSEQKSKVNSKIITPIKTVQNLDSDSVRSPSLDPTEKKQQHAMNYMKYLQREGPKHLGSKEIPKGNPGCFTGLVFVITGVLDSLDREEAVNIIQQYGGKVTSNVSRNTNYLILGDEPGPSKIEKALSLGTTQLDEDGLLNLIITKSKACEDSVPKEAVKVEKNKKKKQDRKSISDDTEALRPTHTDRTETIEKHSHTGEELQKKNHVEERWADNVKASEMSPKIPKNSSSGVNNQNLEQRLVKNTSETSSRIKSSENTTSSLWVDKYRPTSTKQVIGQQGDRSVLKKLTIWLSNWYKNHSSSKKHARPSPWAKNDDGAFYKAALLSGPPGVGKTTMAHLVSKELSFDAVEFNASDTRSKKLLHVEIAELLSSKSLFGYFHSSGNLQPTVKHVLIMDEVDGMAGNEDRGGMQELIQLIKTSHIPIICMCNDRNHPKIRSLVNYCFDLRVSKPRVEQIRGAMMSICFKEGLKISPEALNDTIMGANQDMRQILHNLSMWSVKCKELSTEETKEESQKAKKDMKLGPWDVLKKVFSAEDHKKMSIHDKSDLFFHDYSLSPLFVQENYLSVVPTAAKGNKIKILEHIAQTSDSISMGDLVDKSIRSRNAWNLLPVQAMYSSVIPGDIMEGYLTSQINFPAWLGKNSRRNKFDRLLQELHVHMRLNTSGSKQAINLDYLTPIRDSLLRPLISEGAAGVSASLSVLQQYYLLREDLESLLELTLWPNQKDPMSQVESKVKAALTRAYNKEGIMTPYSMVTVVKKRSATNSQDLDMDEEGDVDEDDADADDITTDDITTDAMIKAKKRPASKESASGSSAPKRGKGKGKKN